MERSWFSQIAKMLPGLPGAMAVTLTTIFAIVVSRAQDMVDDLIESLPIWDGTLTLIQDGFEYLDPWVDVRYAIVLLSTYFTFSIGLITYRIVKSWIPSVSGS